MSNFFVYPIDERFDLFYRFGVTEKRAATKNKFQYRLLLLGGFRLERDGEPITLARAKAKPLLAYLALFPQEHRREKVAADLWLDSTDADARLSLRVTLNSLRTEISPDLVLADRETLQLNPEFPLWVDTREISDLRFMISDLQNATLGEIINLKSKIINHSGDLLPELYDEWLIPERERLREAFLEIALRGVEMARGASDYANAIEIAQHVLKIDRANETAHQHLIFCFAASGNRAAALNQFQECERALREELGVEPSTETRALVERVTQDETRAKSPAAALTNLPKPLTSFVGREREIQELRAMLGRGEAFSETIVPRGAFANENASPLRVLTLLGAGGSGKTRLAIQVARELLDAYKHGVWFVDLAPLADAALVPQAVVKALGLHESVEDTPADLLANFLRRRSVLLILDNCEHLIDACAQLAGHLVSQAPTLTILATSREALNIGGEVVYQVPTLAMPANDEGQKTRDVKFNTQYPAIQLFVERAQAAKSDFRLTEQNAHTVVDICRRLDGMPLAIELAAARMKMFSPQEIAARLDKRFDLLSGGSRGVLPRQQTLRALLDWSYDLLSEPERVLFRRLSVFAGGWTLDAAEQICADVMVPKQNLVQLLAGLVDKSLVLVQVTDDATRYHFLETILEYAREKLLQANEGDELRTRHLDFFIALAEQAEPELFGRNQTLWANRLEQDHDNFRAALHWAFDNNTASQLVQLAGALGYFWYVRGYWRQADEWLGHALQGMNEQIEARWRARISSAAGTAAWQVNDIKRAQELHTRALEIYKALGDEWHTAFSMTNLAVQFDAQGLPERAAGLYDAALQLASRLGSPFLVYQASVNFSLLYSDENNLERAEELLETAMQAVLASGNERALAIAALNLAEVQARRGHMNKARMSLEMAQERIQMGQVSSLSSTFCISYGFVLVMLGELDQAEQNYLAGVEASKQFDSASDLSKNLLGIGVVRAKRGVWSAAARIWGCIEQWRSTHGYKFRAEDIPHYDGSVQVTRQELGSAQFAEDWNAGAKLDLEEVAERVLRGEL